MVGTRVANDILELIGNTPLLRLNKVTKGVQATVLAKCEFMNPSGSIKDRIALRMIEQAEKEGKLRPRSSIIVDSSSGNTGTALAFVGSVRGYKVKIFLPEEWGTKGYRLDERTKIMNCFGAEVVVAKTPPELMSVLEEAGGAAGGVVELGGRKMCYDLERGDPKVWWARQLSNPDNVAAHRETTGKEIVEQTDGKVDALVTSIGTGGTLLGVVEALREVNPKVEVVGVEPESTPLTEWARGGELDKFAEKLGLPRVKSIVNEILERGILDEVIRVGDVDARNMANRLCREEGLFVGMSSGANVFASMKIAKRLGRGKTVVTVLVDRRDRYLGEFPEEHYVT